MYYIEVKKMRGIWVSKDAVIDADTKNINLP
jgi:hypothetical protein